MQTPYCQNPFCLLLTDEEKACVCSHCLQITYQKGQTISIKTQQNYVFILHNGLFTCSTFNAKDEPITTDLYAQNDFLAYFAFAPKDVYPFTPKGVIACVKESAVTMIPIAIAQDLFFSSPKIAKFIITAANERHFKLSVYQYQVTWQDANNALRYVLAYCKKHHIPRLTYDELSKITNLHRVTVTRTMKEILRSDDFKA